MKAFQQPAKSKHAPGLLSRSALALKLCCTGGLLVLLALSFNVRGCWAAQSSSSRIIIDGKLTEKLWQRVPAEKLTPTEPGVPEATGGEVRAVIAGGYLYLGAELPEPSGRVTARSIGFDSVWEGGGVSRSKTLPRRYTYGAPDGEDFVRFIIRVYNENDWMVEVGPLGGYSVKWRWTGEHAWFNSLLYKCNRFLVAAAIGKNEWSVEAAIPLDQIGSPRPGYVQVIAERNRAQRPTAPEEWWRWPAHQPTSGVPAIPPSELKLSAPVLRPPVVGNDKLPPLDAVYVKSLPPLYAKWNDPAWKTIPAWSLRRNEPLARLPRFPTKVKAIQDGRTLAILARCDEPERVIAHAKRRDGPVTEDDSFQVYLTFSGSSYVQYAVNPLGTVLDAAGHQGSHRLSQPYVSWNSPVHAAAWQTHGAWLARLNLPLPQIAETLGALGIPRQWRILLVRYRPERDGEAEETCVLPVTETNTPFCPGRYRRLDLVTSAPPQLPRPAVPLLRSNPLAFIRPDVFSPEQRKQLDLSGMLERHVRDHFGKLLQVETQDWNQVKTVSEWEHFRDVRVKALRASLGKFPASCPLEARVTSTYRGEGYTRENVVYQSQQGLWVTANLYLPSHSHPQMPGMVIIHSLHAPKTQFELQDMGIIWARAGCAVLVMDQLGYGGRIQNYPWDRSNYFSRYIMGEQLYLVGSNLMTWMVQDIERGIDLLLEQPDINQKEIILLGAVAGGGDPAAVTAALDPRVAAAVPFNFGVVSPISDDEWGDWAPIRALRLSVVDQFLPWLICASVAPRYFIFSHEVAWSIGQSPTVAPGMGEVGVGLEQQPAWARYLKVWSFYHALDHLGSAHGFGPFPGPGEAWNIGPSQRRALYPIFARWFGIPSPFTKMAVSKYANLQKNPITNRRPVSDLTVLTPEIASELHMRTVHGIAHDEGEAEVKTAHGKLSGMSPAERRSWLQAAWTKKLGDIQPDPNPGATVEWTKLLPHSEVEAIALKTETGIEVPLLLLLPRHYAPFPHAVSMFPVPVVVAVAEGGKARFLADRSSQIESMLRSGIAVCLPDVRGTGETSPDLRRDPDSEQVFLGSSDLMLGHTLLGKRLKDLRTVLGYLEGRHDLDPHKVGLWGDSFMPPNPAHLLLDEQPNWQISPEIEQHAEPLGGLLALLGALYDPNVRAVAVHGGLASFLSMLDDSFIYVPEDVVVPGSLEIGDIADIASALAPRPLTLEGTVDGRDCLVAASTLHRELQPIEEAYQSEPSSLSINAAEGNSNFAEWFRDHL
ncbi:MAG: acetylxylan esterase [Terriglobia bacterium]